MYSSIHLSHAMDYVLISLETVRESLMRKRSLVYDEEEYRNCSTEFAEAIKEVVASGLRNMRRTEAETRLDSDTNSETVDKGLFRRRKLLLALEPSENFPAQIYREPLARRASFPAIGSSSEICLPLNISKASSSPDNWTSSLRNDLPSIAESSDEGTVTVALSSQITTNGKNVSRFKACNGGFAGSQNTSRQPAVKANHSQRSSKSPRSSNCSTNASKFRNNIANRKGVTRSKSDNWKIRVHKTIIIDDDSFSQSSRSSSSSRPSSWCGDTRFPSIDRPVKKHSY